MHKNWWIFLLVVVGFASLGYILTQFSISEVLGSFRAASPLYVVGYLVAVVLIMLMLSWRWHIILLSQGHRFRLFDIFKFKIVGWGVNFITPGPRVGGEPVQASLLSRAYPIRFDKALSSIVIDKTIELWTSGLFFILGVVVVFFRFALPKNLAWLLAVISLIFAALMITFISKVLSGKEFFMPIMRATRLSRIPFIARYERKLVQFERLIVKFYDQDKKYFLYAILISLASWFLMFFEYHFAMRFFGIAITPLQTFLIFSFVGAAYLFPIPLSLGVLEASQISVFNIIGINPVAGVGLAMIIRFKDIVWSCIGFLVLFFHSMSFKQVMKESIDEPSLMQEIDRVEPPVRLGRDGPDADSALLKPPARVHHRPARKARSP